LSLGTRHPPVCSQQLATHIRRAQFVFLEHSGHFPYIQERAAFWEAVRTFLPPLGIPPCDRAHAPGQLNRGKQHYLRDHNPPLSSHIMPVRGLHLTGAAQVSALPPESAWQELDLGPDLRVL